MNKMKIEIWSDIACPYCYLGLKKLEIALNKFAHKDEIELVWHSYELNPSLPIKASGIKHNEYLSETNETPIEEVESDTDKIVLEGKELGLVYHFDKVVIANTSFALRLIKLANTYGLATEAEDAFFKAYFTEGKDISDRDTLIQIGTELGLKELDIANMLDSDKYADKVKEDTKYGDEVLNLEFIPYYLFNNKNIIQGVIAIDELTHALKKSYEEWKETGVGTGKGDIISGQSCSIDGVCT